MRRLEGMTETWNYCNKDKSGIQAVAFAPNGLLLASGDRNGKIHLGDVEKTKLIASFMKHTGPISCLGFSPCGNYLASGSYDKSCRIWDIKDCKEVVHVKDHNHFVTSICFFPDGQAVASVGSDRTVRIWDSKTGQGRVIWSIPQPKQISPLVLVGANGHPNFYPVPMTMSPDGKILAVGMHGIGVKLWRANQAGTE